jgi:outer membrane receptor protein involved in Fe transport
LTPAHDNLDASVTYTPPSGGLTFTVGGRNLTNDVYPVGGFNIANGFVAAVRFPSLPRRYYAKVAYRF